MLRSQTHGPGRFQLTKLVDLAVLSQKMPAATAFPDLAKDLPQDESQIESTTRMRKDASVPDQKKFFYGQFQLQGFGQLMADGTWSAYCVITEHLGSHSDAQKRLMSGSFETEEEAAEAGLDLGKKWFEENYPLPD